MARMDRVIIRCGQETQKIIKLWAVREVCPAELCRRSWSGPPISTRMSVGSRLCGDGS